MAPVTFSHVPAEAFDALARELQTGPWAQIDISVYAGPNQTPLRPLREASGLVSGKIRLLWALERHAIASKGAGQAKKLDQDWDGAQRRFNARLELAAVDADANIREAASRVRERMTQGAGTAQTRLSYQQEVDFGNRQLAIAADEGAADVQLLDLGSAIEDIRRTTQALAECIGHGQNNQTPAKRLRSTTVECAAACAHVHGYLVWLEDNGQPDDARLAATLQAPLAALAARYPGTASSADDADEEPPDDDPAPGGDGPSTP